MAPKDKTTGAFLKAACAYAALTLFLAWPLLMSFGSRVPVDDGDPLFNTWVMAWNGHALLTDPLELFSANIYYPYSDTLAYSDLLLIPSLAALPLNLIFDNPLVAYNLLFLLSFVFSGLAMFLLARLLTGSAPAAFFAGLAYAFSTYRISQMGHFQLLTDGLLVIMVYFAHTYLRTHRLRDILLAGVCLAFQALTSWYYGFYAAFVLAALLVFYTGAKVLKLNKRLMVHLACLSALTGAIIGPFALPYLRLRASMPGFGRTLGEAVYFSARWSDYFSTKNPLLLKLAGGSWVSSGANMWEHLLWPGLFAIAFSIGGLFVKRRLPRTDLAGDEGRTRLFYLLLGLCAFVLSLGPFLWVGDFRLSLPYLGAWWFVPGFKAMRVPARFGALVTFSLVILAAYGFRDTVEWLKGRFALSRSVEYSAGAALAIVVMATQVNGFFLLSGPVTSATASRSVYSWLARRGESVVIELPSVDVKGGAVVGGWNRDVRYLLGSTRHWRKLVNGYSGYAPPEYGRIMEAVGSFPGGDSIAVMRALGVDYLVYHTGGDRRLAKVLTRRAKQSPAVSDIKRFGDDLLFAVKPSGYPVLGPITRLGRRPPLTAFLARPGPVSTGKAVNLAWKVKNPTGKTVIVGIDEQPVAYYSWAGGADKPVWPRLPMVFKAGRTAWMEAQLEGPPLPGAQRLRLELRSPLIKSGIDNLTIEARAGMMTSLKGDGLGGRFGKVVLGRTAKAAGDLAATVTVKNTGKALWVARFDPSTALELPYDKGEVHIAAFWYTAAGRQVGEPQVFKLAHDLGPDQTYADTLPLKAPRRPGAYRVKFDLVDLGVAWFKDLGTVRPSFHVRVR